LAAAKQNGGGADMALDIMKQWGDGDLSEYMKAHREKAMAAGEAIAGGFLVPDQFSQDVIDLLRPMSVVRGLGPVSMPMPTGTMRVPKITSGSTGYYIGENSTITKSQVATGQLTLTWKKLAALVPISNDLLRFSSPGADAIVRDDMVRSIAQRENAAFLRGDGTSASPKGLRYWAPAANIIAANSTVNLANVTVDLGKLILQLKNNNIPMTRPAWIMSPRSEHYLATVQNGNGFFVFRDEVLSGRLWGFPLAVTTEVPVNLTDGGGTNESEIYLVDMADAVIGEAKSSSVDSSGEAAYTAGGSLVSSYSQDQTVIRAIAEHDFAMRREESVTLLNQCTWGG
jgi:HK97 family phage major capsid protein